MRVTGVTVHWSDEQVDSGPILCRRPWRFRMMTTAVELERRIHEVEHRLLPQAVRRAEIVEDG